MPEKGPGEKLSRKKGWGDLQGLETECKILNGRIRESQPEVSRGVREGAVQYVSGRGHSRPVQRLWGGIV